MLTADYAKSKASTEHMIKKDALCKAMRDNAATKTVKEYWWTLQSKVSTRCDGRTPKTNNMYLFRD